MQLVDSLQGSVVVGELAICETMMESMRGLLGRDALRQDEGLLIPACRSIHMIGMRFAIDVIYLDSGGCVRKIVEHLCPWALSGCLWASSVVEVPAGRVRAKGVHVGQTLDIVPAECANGIAG